MYRILLVIFGSVVLLSAGSGCAFGHYWMDRGNDLVDMFGLRVSGNLGFGLEANVRATEFFQTGIGWSEKYVIGISGREFGCYLEQSYSMPFTPSDWVPWIYPTPFGFERGIKRTPIFGNFPEVGVERQVSFLPSYGSKYRIVSDVPWAGRKKTSYDRWGGDIGFSACAGFLVVAGVEAEVRLHEVFDFILGWFTIDFMKDDKMRKYIRGELEKPAEKAPEKKKGSKAPKRKPSVKREGSKAPKKKSSEKKEEGKAPKRP